MALLKCRDCGNEVSTAANACPKCGAPMPTASPKRIAKGVGYGCASVFVGVLILAAIGAATGGKKTSSTTTVAGTHGALSACMRLSGEPAPKACFRRCVVARETTMNQSADTRKERLRCRATSKRTARDASRVLSRRPR